MFDGIIPAKTLDYFLQSTGTQGIAGEIVTYPSKGNDRFTDIFNVVQYSNIAPDLKHWYV